MNKKNLVLISKCCLLLAFLGFCLPIFKGATGFAPIPHLLSVGPNDLTVASSALKEYDAAHEKDVASLKELKATVDAKVKEAKANSKPKLAEAKAAREAAMQSAKEKYNKDKPELAVTIENIKKEYEIPRTMFAKLLEEVKSVKGEDEASILKSISDEGSRAIAATLAEEETLAQLASGVKKENIKIDFVKLVKNAQNKLDKAEKADIKEAENRLETSRKRGIASAKKKYTRVESAVEKELKSIEDEYWSEYDKYGDPRKELLKAKKNASREVMIPIALIIFVACIIASILFSTVHYVTLKKNTYSKIHYIVDLVLYILIILSAVYAFNNIKKIETDLIYDMTFSFGYYLVILGLVGGFVIYLFSTTLDENISSASEERRAYWMLSLPAILFYFAVMTFPAIFSVVLSFTNYSGGSLFERDALNFIGFKNYVKVFQDPYFYISLKNNFWIVFISVFGQLPLGFLLAYVLNRGLVKGRDFFQTMIYLPCVISTVVIGILFQTFFSAKGAWTELMRVFNPTYQWSMNNHPMLPVLFVILWMYVGTYLIIFLANLQKLDPAIIEAATIDGATEGQVLWNIIFPELSGTFVISAILAISGSLKSFDLIYVMTAGGPAKQTYVLSLYMFDKAFKGQADYPMANTISTIMVVISLALIAVVKVLEKKFGTSDDD